MATKRSTKTKTVYKEAFPDSDGKILDSTTNLQEKYKKFSLKTEKLNFVTGKLSESQREEALIMVENMKKVMEIMEKHIKGELIDKDVTELEEAILKCDSGKKNIMEFLNNIR